MIKAVYEKDCVSRHGMEKSDHTNVFLLTEMKRSVQVFSKNLLNVDSYSPNISQSFFSELNTIEGNCETLPFALKKV